MDTLRTHVQPARTQHTHSTLPAADYFPFLTDPSNLRNRTTFYHTLARLLFMEDTPAKFKSFVAPLQQVRAGHVLLLLVCCCGRW